MTGALRRVLAVAGAGCVLVALPPAAALGAPSATSVRAGEWWLSKLHISKAWSLTEGAGQKVAVIDSGIEGSHPDLSGAVVGGTDESGKGSPSGLTPVGSDEPEHATAMAGFIAGRGHGVGKKLGLLGVAPQASLLSVSVDLDPDELNQAAPISRAVRWAVDHGAKVINMSFIDSEVSASDIAYAEAHDVVLVAGAGNGGDANVESPASKFGVVAVSGVDQDLSVDPKSSYGGPVLLNPTSGVDDATGGTAVSAPFSTGPSGSPGMPSLTLVKDGSYATTNGTSNSTAIVSGVVALIRARFPSMDAANVVNRLIKTAYHPAGTGYAPGHGFGVVDAYQALTANVPMVCENPLGSQATKSLGVWASIANKTTYKPACTGSSSAPATPGSGASSPATSGSSDSSSVPGWVWVLIAAGVLVLTAVLVIVRRRSGRRGGPPGGPPPGQGPPGYGPPGYGPPGNGPT